MANLPVDSLDCSFSLHKLSLSLSHSLSRYTCFSFLFLFLFCKNLKPLFLSLSLTHFITLSLSTTHFLSFPLPKSLCIYLFQYILLTYSHYILPLVSSLRKFLFLFPLIFSTVLSRHCFPINTEASLTPILKKFNLPSPKSTGLSLRKPVYRCILRPIIFYTCFNPFPFSSVLRYSFLCVYVCVCKCVYVCEG